MDMSIRNVCDYTGLTRQAIYKQIKIGNGYGPYFYRNDLGKWRINSMRVKGGRSMTPEWLTVEECAKRSNGDSVDKLTEYIRKGIRTGVLFEKIENIYFISRSNFYKYFKTRVMNFTNYPELFDCYWGSFRFSSLMDNLDDFNEFVKNRNELVDKYRLKNKSKRTPYRYYKCLDHTESYTIEGSRDVLVISSPYGFLPKEGEINNWFSLPDMYARSANTFGFWYSENKHLFGRYNRKLVK